MLFAAFTAAAAPAPTFYRDVLPILAERCQGCHRPGQIAPMPFLTYREVRPWARAIREQALTRRMPPWFAEPGPLHFANDPSLTPAQIDTLARWAASGAPAGEQRDAPAPRRSLDAWNIDQPDHVFTMPAPVSLPASGDIDYTYVILPSGFTADTWVHMAEIRPSSRANVHHAVVYIRPPASPWLRTAPLATPFTAGDLSGAQAKRDAMWTDSDVLLVYAPGSSPDRWPANMAKLIPAGSDLVFQMHYVSRGSAARDQTSVGLVTAAAAPAQRVLTLQLTNDRFIIPPGVDDFRVEVHGTIPNDALLLSFFPHMHLRGKRFAYNLIHSSGHSRQLLKVNYDFYWQLSYRLSQPLPLRAGDELQAVAWYDNSKNNPHNPDPGSAVHWGDQTSDEMMVGFFDVAVPSGVDKWRYFHRSARH